MQRPVQPQFKIRVYTSEAIPQVSLRNIQNGKTQGGDDYIDIEQCVAYPVTYSEEASLLNTISFTIDKMADVLLFYFRIGQRVSLFGGYYTEDSSGMRHVFTGTVSRIRTSFSNSGRVSISIECISYGFTKMGNVPRNLVYPDPKSSRTWARKDSLNLEEVITNIAKDNNFNIGEISLSPDAKRMTFDRNSFRYQKDMTDWQFLEHLAQISGSSIWTSYDTENKEKLYFMSNSKCYEKNTVIQFLYPLQGHYGIKQIEDSEIQKFDDPAYNRPRILRDVTVDEDISSAYAVSRTAVYFDKSTGETKDVVSEIKEDKDGNKYMVFYELDEQKVEYIHRTDPGLADSIRDNSPTSMEWGTPDNPKCASYYYRQIKVYDEQTAVFDRAFFGIKLSATCNQDLDIRSQRIYPVRGILSYHSKNSINSKFFLKGLRHVWDSDGTRTELDFIR